jgi:hypothetical protein
MPRLTTLLRSSSTVASRAEALQQISERELRSRLGRDWQVILPGVYITHRGPVSPDERRRAALKYAGPGGMLDDTTALVRYGVRYLPRDELVRVLVPDDVQRKSRDFVEIRRTIYRPTAMHMDGLPHAPLARALAHFALRHRDERDVLAVLADSVQRRLTTVEALHAEYKLAPARGKPQLHRVLEALDAGVRSAPEGDIRALVETSKVLPQPLYNPLVQLPSGRLISPDLLIVEAALVHETNSREHHEGEDVFESMQERHDEMTTAGLLALHNSPRMIAIAGRRVLSQLEECYLQRAGCGLPPGVTIIRHAAT